MPSIPGPIQSKRTAGLRAIPVDGKGVTAQRLNHEVGDDAPVIGLEARAVGVENSDQAGVDAVVAVIGHHGSF